MIAASYKDRDYSDNRDPSWGMCRAFWRACVLLEKDPKMTADDAAKKARAMVRDEDTPALELQA